MSFSNLICSRLVTYCIEQSKAYEYRMTDLWMDALKSQDLLNGHKRTFVRQSDGETIATENLTFTNFQQIKPKCDNVDCGQIEAHKWCLLAPLVDHILSDF